MMLDNGSEVFLWFGKNSSEMEKKLALKSAQVHIFYFEVVKKLVQLCGDSIV